MKNISTLIKPISSKCNINCKYCFYKDEDKLRKDGCFEKMSLKTLELIVKRVFEVATNQASFVFQGGEPTLMGLSFYQSFISFTKKYNVNNIKTFFSIQTNGILLDKDWCIFLKENNFLVGLSFDGTPEINDINRITYDNKGTSSLVINSIRLLQKYNVDFNILFVVSHEAYNKAKESYKYCKNLGIEYLQIIPVLDPFGNPKESEQYSLSKKDLEIFLCDLFDIWYNDFINNKEVRITYFENIITSLINGKGTMCSMNGLCSIETVIEANGNVYPCDFYVSDKYCLGNIYDNNLKELIFSQKAIDFISESINLKNDCTKCKYCNLCMGSCKRYSLNNINEYKNYYCESYQNFFNYTLDRIIKIAKIYSS